MSRIYSLILSIGVFVLALDQWTKNLILEHFPREGDLTPWLSWFHIHRVHNYGVAFGNLRNLPDGLRPVLLILLPIAILTGLWYFYVRKFQKKELLGPIAMGLVLGGAIGNLIDRLRFGYVVDFVDWFYPSNGGCLPGFSKFTPETCHWAVFNVADSAISVAMVILIADSFLNPKDDAKKA